MNRSLINWGKIERFAIYASSFGYALAKVVSTLFPKTQVYLPEKGQVFLQGIAILAALTYVVKQLEKLTDRQPIVGSNFSQGFETWMEPYKDKTIGDLIICAYTSHTFREFLWARRLQMGHVRVLLFYASDDFPNVAGEPDESISDINSYVKLWKQMETDGRIEKLEVRRRKTNASLFFGVANNERMLQGLLWPREKMGGLEPKHVMMLGPESSFMREAVANYVAWFEAMWAVSEVIVSQNQEP